MESKKFELVTDDKLFNDNARTDNMWRSICNILTHSKYLRVILPSHFTVYDE